jgi:hypothetical protein
MLRRPKPRKPLSPLCSSIANNQEAQGLPHKRTTAGCSCISSGGSVINPLRQAPSAPPQERTKGGDPAPIIPTDGEITTEPTGPPLPPFGAPYNPRTHTIGKRATFLSFYIFLNTEEYNRAIFLCTKNEKCMVNQ